MQALALPRHVLALALALVVAASCKAEENAPAAGEAAPAAAATREAAASEAAVGEAAASEAAAEGDAIVWIHDEWAAAQAASRARGLPIVADMWAPWCHTCLSMQSTVLRDPALRPYVGRFVWLAADTDRAENAELLAGIKMSMWPTFFVLDADARVQASFAGASSVAQFRAFLEDGEAAFLDSRGQALAEDDPRRKVREGARALQAGAYDEADAAFAAALAAAPPQWPRRADVLVDQIRARSRAERWEACVALAEAELDEVAGARVASSVDFMLYAERCASELEAGRVEALRRRMVAAFEAIVADPEAALSVDDRSDLLANLRAVLLALGEEARAREVARRQLDLLSAAWRDALSPRVAMTYAWPRAEVAVFLGEGESVVADLEALAGALPDEYDPPYRLAWTLLKLGRADEALPWAERAAAATYGPRKARAQGMVAEIQAARGDKAAEREARAAVVATWRSLPLGQQDPKALASAEAALAAVK